MALVAYSDSEGSESEENPKNAPKAVLKPTQINYTSANFAVNKSNPRKIQVSLGTSGTGITDRDGTEEPAPKRAKLGGGGLSGFNAMLPAPKREHDKKPVSGGTTRKVFSLKTGAEPGFNREADDDLRQLFAEQTPTPQANDASMSQSTTSSSSEARIMGNPMRFRPLSVARNTKKKPLTGTESMKKIVSSAAIAPLLKPDLSAPEALPATKTPKINLFSAEVEYPPETSTMNRYEVTDTGEDTYQQMSATLEEIDNPSDKRQSENSTAASAQCQSLDTIASDLNLSAADRRRLFGREGKGSNSAINIVNFNTDKEYAANEALRASGEQVQHNPIRGIAPGKHSLKQLVNAASTQKDALEESFAAGKSNKREAGSRYGW